MANSAAASDPRDFETLGKNIPTAETSYQLSALAAQILVALAAHAADLVGKVQLLTDDSTGPLSPLKAMVGQGTNSAASLEKAATGLHVLAGHAQHLEAMAKHGTAEHPVHVHLANPMEFRFELHPTTIEAITLAVRSRAPGDDLGRRELLAYVHTLRNAVAEALAETRRPRFEEATRWLEEIPPHQPHGR
jgi:hypothetical protein